jgi:siroheme synthase-like protein
MAARLFYPIFLDVSGRRAVVIGGGKVAFRKAAALLDAGAGVTVIAPEFDEGLRTLRVERIEREYREGDLEGAHLAFAATNQRAVNASVAREAKALGIAVNVADSPSECDFIVPARVRRGYVNIAISTSGTNPSLAANIRRAVEKLLDDILREEARQHPADN